MNKGSAGSKVDQVGIRVKEKLVLISLSYRELVKDGNSEVLVAARAAALKTR